MFSKVPHYSPGKPPLPLFDIDYDADFERTWGGKWGARSAVGRLRRVMVHRPGAECESPMIAQDPALLNLPEGLLNLELMRKEHDRFVVLLKAEGVAVEYLNPSGEALIGTYGIPLRSACYTRESVILDGGAIIERPAMAYKRGLERFHYKRLAELGCPVLHTVRGEASFEASNLVYLDPKHAILATSVRTNQAGIEQVMPLLREAGVEEIHMAKLPGYLESREFQVGGASGYFHLDMTFGTAADGLVVLYPGGVDYETIHYLKQKQVNLVEVPETELRNDACNLLPLAPGKVMIPSGNSETTRRLRKEGVDVIEIEFSEFVKGGGGPTCATLPLLRD